MVEVGARLVPAHNIAEVCLLFALHIVGGVFVSVHRHFVLLAPIFVADAILVVLRRSPVAGLRVGNTLLIDFGLLVKRVFVH